MPYKYHHTNTKEAGTRTSSSAFSTAQKIFPFASGRLFLPSLAGRSVPVPVAKTKDKNICNLDFYVVYYYLTHVQEDNYVGPRVCFVHLRKFCQIIRFKVLPGTGTMCMCTKCACFTSSFIKIPSDFKSPVYSMPPLHAAFGTSLFRAACGVDESPSVFNLF